MRYLYDTEFFLTIRVPLEKTAVAGVGLTFVISGQVCPGELNREEPVIFHGLDGLKTGVERWIGRIKGEIEATPVLRRLKEQEDRRTRLQR